MLQERRYDMENKFALKPYQSAAAARIIHAFSKEKRQMFILADEAGLGKTFVALQVIASLYTERLSAALQGGNPVFNVYYMCSNKRILTNNGEKMTGKLKRKGFPVVMAACDRLSMVFQQEAKAASICFYEMSSSLLDDAHSDGTAEEASVFLTELKKLQATYTDDAKASSDLKKLKQFFLEAYAVHSSRNQTESISDESWLKWWVEQLEAQVNSERAKLSSVEFNKIRTVFNRYSFYKNPPDLIIVDEFHRMDGVTQYNVGPDTYVGDLKGLAQLKQLALEAKTTKLLFLSATPYRFTMQDLSTIQKREEYEEESEAKPSAAEKDDSDRQEDENNAFQSFTDFLSFFVEDEKERKNVLAASDAHKRALKQLEEAEDQKAAWKTAEQRAQELGILLSKFMSRSERGRLADMSEPEKPETSPVNYWEQADLPRLAKDWDKDKAHYLRRIPGVYSYALKFNKVRKDSAENTFHRYQSLKYCEDRDADAYLWTWNPPELAEDVSYNPQLSAIDAEAITGMERLLWLPPIRPYYQADPGSEYAEKEAKDFSKLLVFSNYQFIPRAVGSIFSEIVQQRNIAVARKKGCHAEDIAFAPLPEEEVQQLAKAVPLELMRSQLTAGALVERLFFMPNVRSQLKSLIGDCKGEELGDCLREKLWAAIGSPQVCLHRMLAGKSQQVEDYINNSAKLLADKLLKYVEENSHEKTSGERKGKNCWDWCFYTSEKTSDYWAVKNETLSSHSYKGRTRSKNLWYVLTEILLPQMEQDSEEGEFLRELYTDGVDAYKHVYRKQFAAQLTKALERDLKAELKYCCDDSRKKRVVSWIVPEDLECLRPALEKSVKKEIETRAQNVLSRTDLFRHYYEKKPVKWALAAAGVKTREDYFRYCANGNLQAVLEEYCFLCDQNPVKFIFQLYHVLSVRGSKVHLLTADIEAGLENQYIGAEEIPAVTCSFSERYTADVEDSQGTNETWQRDIQDAFNSPFWPFVLTTTSVAQEGLDFHQYCRKIMHYTAPHTPMALEQREGRIDRFRGYFQRLRQAERNPKASLQELFAEDEPGTYGVCPGWVVKKGASRIDIQRVPSVIPFTRDAFLWDRLLLAKNHYRNIIGMPDDYLPVENLEKIKDNLNHNQNASPYQMTTLFPDLTPIRSLEEVLRLTKAGIWTKIRILMLLADDVPMDAAWTNTLESNVNAFLSAQRRLDECEGSASEELRQEIQRLDQNLQAFYVSACGSKRKVLSVSLVAIS